jgi:succinate dehydrogenase/fumarate reductase flavoprotein subunit
MSKKIVQLKNSTDIKNLKEQWVNQQNGICPILKLPFELDNFVIDHSHCKSKEAPDELLGTGFCRGAIHHNANVVEGKILKDCTRYGITKFINIADFLRNLADYIETNRFHTEETIYIHSTEKPSKPKLSKSSYNKLIKTIDNKCKIPPYQDKKGNFNKKLQELFLKYNVEPTFIKN